MIIKQAVKVANNAVGATNLETYFEDEKNLKLNTRSHAASQTSIAA